MDKKRINILLLALVIIIYSFSIYKFFYKNESKQKIEDRAYSIPNPEKVTLSKLKDTFHLKIPTHDPFLNLIYKNTKEKKEKNQQQKIPEVRKIAFQKKWPSIQYLGFIKSNKSKKRALLKINGHREDFIEGEIADEIIIQKIYSDSIIVEYNNENKIIYK